MLQDIAGKASGLREKMLQLLDDVRENPRKEGLSFLDAKCHSQLAYLQNLTYYLLLKVSGEQVAEHPVLDDLFSFRTLLEKMRPIDEKLRYRIDKILASKKEEESKPNIDDMMTSITDDEDDAPKEKEEEETKEEGVYKAPKISSVEYTGDHLVMADKAQKQLDRQAERMRKSQMVRDLREEFTDMPQEIRSESLKDKTLIAIEKKMNERQEFEETNMTRLTVTKKDKRDMRKLEGSKFSGGRSEGLMSLTDMSDFSGMSGGNALAGFEDAKANVRKTKSIVSQAHQSRSDGSSRKRRKH